MQLNFFTISGLLLSVTSFVLVVTLLIYGKTKLHKICTIFNLFVLVWGIGTVLISIVSTPSQALVSWKIAVTGGLFIAVLFYHTVYIFGGLVKKKILVIVYFQAIVFWLLSCFVKEQIIFGGLQFIFNSFFYPKATVIWNFMAVGWGFVSVLGHYELLKFIKKSKGIIRVQGIYLLVGVALGFLGGGSILLPSWGIPLYPVGNFGVALYAIIITYAILRYRILDIRVALTRGTALVATYSLVFGLPLSFILVKPWLVSLLGRLWWAIPVGLFAVLALVGPFMAIFLIHRLEQKRIQREEEARDALEASGQGMIEIENMERLAKLIPKYLTKFYLSRLGIRISSALVFLLDEERGEFVFKSISGEIKIPGVESLPEKNNPLSIWFKEIIPLIVANKLMPKKELEVLRAEDIAYWQSHDKLLSVKAGLKQNLADLGKTFSRLKASLCVPSFYQEELLGFLILGEKKDGMYNEEEIAQFRRLARYAAIAIRNAQIIQKLKDSQASLFQAAKLTSVGELASGFAHEIKNPLAVISLAAGSALFNLKENPALIEKEDFLNELKGNLAKIEAQTMKAAEIITRIRNFAKPASEDFAALNLSEVVKNSLELTEHTYAQKGMNLQVQVPSDLPKIRGIAVNLEEVFVNLITNACDAMENREPKEFKIRAALDKEAPGMVRIEASDNGAGISAKDLPKLFNFFFTTKGHKGTGIGLAIVYQIIRHHRGMIEVKSEPDKGTTFIMHLPIWKEP